MVRKFLLCIIFLLGSLSSVYAENLIQTRVHEDKIYQGESFLLIISAIGKFNENDLDLRPLTKMFTVGDTSFTYNSNKNLSIWRIPMISRQDGIQTIPSILIKDNVSTPFPITVRRPHANSAKPELKNLINTDIKSNNFYVNETIIIKTVINKTRNIDISSISAPTLEGKGQIHLIYEDTKQKTSMGQESSIITRVYAASFREPGVHKIYPVMVNGTYLLNNANGNVTISNNNESNKIIVSDPSKDGNFGKKKLRFVQQTEPYVVTIKTIPNQKNLLVADDLKIVEKWDPEIDTTLNVNLPISHEISFSATGVSVADLPHPLITATPQYKAYHDKQDSYESYDPNTGILTSKLVLKQVYVPLKNMILKFEPLEISWIKRDPNSKSSINLFKLNSPTFTIVGDANEQYDLKNSNNLQLILLFLIVVISILIILCVIYLLYLEGIISFDFYFNWNNKRKARKYLIKNFSTTDAKLAYQQLISFAQAYYGPQYTSFEKMPGYKKYQKYLDEISQILWNTHKVASGEGYDGSEFKKLLPKFTKSKIISKSNKETKAKL